LRCIQVIAGVLGRAGQSGQEKRLEAAKTGEVTWLSPPGLGKPKKEDEEKKAAATATPITPKADIDIEEGKLKHTRGPWSKKGIIDLEDEDDL
jgi:small subunit ribosomal protein S2